MLSEDNLHRYLRALYLVGLLLVFVPLMDLLLRSFPPQFGTLQWRFATTGLMLGNYGTILLGTGLIGLVAALVGDRGALRALGMVALVMAVVTLAVVLLFALDTLQIRRLAAANYKRPITLSAAGALFTGVFATLVWGVLGRAALVASRAVARVVPGSRSRAAAPIVVSAPTGTSEAV